MGYISGAHGLCSAFPIVLHSTTSNHLEEENGIVSVEEGNTIVNVEEGNGIVNVNGRAERHRRHLAYKLCCYILIKNIIS